MIIDQNNIIYLIKYISQLFDNKCILTGSAADFLHLNYQYVQDIDFVVEHNLYYDIRKLSSINKNHPFNLLTRIGSLKNTKDHHLLHTYLYDNIYQIDLLIKEQNLISKNIQTLQINTQTINLFSPETRLEQLKKYNYRNTIPEFHIKYANIMARIAQYNEMLEKLNSGD